MKLSDHGIDDSAFETWVEERDTLTHLYKRPFHDFYDTPAWRILRYEVLKAYGRSCMRCEQYKNVVHVDHIRPRAYYPDLELDFNNMQVLCEKCNLDKGTDVVDYRKAPQFR